MRSHSDRSAGGGAAPSGEGTTVHSVSSLTHRIKQALESGFPPCWVRGEVSNLRLQSSGHAYFSLKDAGAQLACVLFRGDAARTGSRAALRDGAQVLVFGSLSVYEPRGSYQLVVRVVVDDGVGRLQQEFERLKQRLAAEGLFDQARKKPLPAIPSTVGFITSPTGAVAQDFIRILKRRHWLGRLIVLPVKVQGEGAAAEMMAALRLAGELSSSPEGPAFDLLVIGRGGGSLEDLWAFNEEPLVRAVAACPIPIVSAVGHEIDFTLCDFAADVRAETPSAAAELITSGFLDFVERLRQAAEGLDEAAAGWMRSRKDELRLAAAHLQRVAPWNRLERAFLQLDDVHNRLHAAVRHLLAELRHRLAVCQSGLAQLSPEVRVAQVRERLAALAARLAREGALSIRTKRQELERLRERMLALGPETVLRRGYVILRAKDGRPVERRDAVHPGDRLTAQFRDGEAPLRAE